MNITVHSVKYVGINPNQTLAIVSTDEQPEPFGFFVALDKEDNSEIYKAVIEKINNKEIEIEPSDVNKTEYYSYMVRQDRNKLLDETDKYMTLDYPISEEKRGLIRQYRQSLRDIPQQKGFPENVVWPEKPNIEK